MRGHIRRRGSKWVIVVHLGYDEAGKRRQKWFSGFETKRDASRKLTEVLGRLETGTYVEPSKETVGAFLREWSSAIRETVRTSTATSYRMNAEWYIIPHLGTIPLQRLTSAHLNTFYADLLTDGRRRGEGGLSPRTVRYVHTIIRKALADAVRWNKLPRNVADQADPPRRRTAPEMRVWSADEVRVLLEHVHDERLYAAWLLFVTTGMRRGEVAGLRWESVDLEANRLSVTRTLISVQNVMTISTPKTDKGRRQIALDPATVAALRAHRIRQSEERLQWGAAWEDNGLVFCWENGKAIHPDRLSQQFHRYIKCLGLPRIRLHDLRHTYATLALRAGVPAKIVSERLGHSTISITLDTYSHVLPDMQEEAAAKVAKLVVG